MPDGLHAAGADPGYALSHGLGPFAGACQGGRVDPTGACTGWSNGIRTNNFHGCNLQISLIRTYVMLSKTIFHNSIRNVVKLMVSLNINQDNF